MNEFIGAGADETPARIVGFVVAEDGSRSQALIVKDISKDRERQKTFTVSFDSLSCDPEVFLKHCRGRP